jgi:lipopolysaccharide export system protein LptA
MSLPADALGAVPLIEGVVPGDEAGASDRVEVQAAELDVWPDPETEGVDRALFQDSVRLRKGAGVLECERLEVQYAGVSNGATGSEEEARESADGWALIGASAEGGVRFRQSTNELSGASAVYTAESGIMELAGPVAWESAGSRGRSDRMRWSMDDGTTEALGQVRMTLPAASFEAFTLVGANEPLSLAPGPEEISTEGEGQPSPVEVTCERLVFREAGEGREFRVTSFLGGVEVISEPWMRMACERLLAELVPITNSLHRLVATGNVVMENEEPQGRRIARGDRAEYLASEDRLWLTGDDGVEMDLVDAEGTHRGRGGLAVYRVGDGTLELRNGAVLESVHGRLSGERVRVNREERILAAGGKWRMVIPLRKEAQDALKALEQGEGQ